LRNLEKLAREICWREFSPPRSKRRIGHTKAGYWSAVVTPQRRHEYMQDAEWLMWAMKTLPVEMLASDYCKDG